VFGLYDMHTVIRWLALKDCGAPGFMGLSMVIYATMPVSSHGVSAA
jgi:hypothetical protein